MPTMSALLMEEHSGLRGQIEGFRELAEDLDRAGVEIVIAQAESLILLLQSDILPHAKGEELVLYRAYDQLADSPWATDTMRHDHDQIERLMKELVALRLPLLVEPLTAEEKKAFRLVLYQLYSLLTTHLDKEEQILLPRLDASLTPEANEMLASSFAAVVHHAKDVHPI